MKLHLSLPAAVLLSLSVSAVLAKDKPSEAFLKKAIEGNYAEVSMGDLAQRERSERRRQVVCENAFN
jgi:putative membrane protein